MMILHYRSTYMYWVQNFEYECCCTYEKNVTALIKECFKQCSECCLWSIQVNFLLVSSFRTISWRRHIFSTFQIPFLWARRETEKKNGAYYKSNHKCSATIEKPRMKQDSMMASKYGKIYVLLRLLAKYSMQYHDIFYCLVNCMIYNISFLSAQFLFIDYSVRNVTGGKKSSITNNDYTFPK